MISDFRQGVSNLLSEHALPDEGAVRVLALYDSTIEGLIEVLRSKVAEWEQIDPDDQHLYSLGLRHAIDLLQEERGQ